MAEEKLVRGIGRFDLTAIAINTIIGAGIFTLPATVSKDIGNYSLFAFVACALIVGLIVLCFAEVSSRFESTGGMYLYAREAFGPAVGFEVGWLYWVVRIATFATNANILVKYLGYFGGSPDQGWTRTIILTSIIAVLAVVNFTGVRQSALMTNFFTVGKLVPLILFVIIGAFFVSPGNFTFGEVPSTSKFSVAVLTLIYAFVGFEAAVIPAGETKDARRTLPFALIAALGVVTLLFVGVQIVAIGTLPGLAASERPLADAARAMLGEYGAQFIVLGAVVSILGNLNVGFLAATRIPFAMAENRELPGVFARTHSRFKTPWVALAATTLAVFLFTIQTSLLTALTIATITRLIVYATTCAALPVFRRRADAPPAGFTAPFGIVASILSLVLIAWLLTRVDYAKEGFVLVGSAVVGLVIFGILRATRKSDDPEASA